MGRGENEKGGGKRYQRTGLVTPGKRRWRGQIWSEKKGERSV